MPEPTSLKPQAIATGLAAAGMVATAAFHSAGKTDQAKQAAAATAAIAGTALIFSRNQKP